MMIRKLFTALLLVVAVAASSQTNFVVTPEKPKAGDLITITYEPAGDIANTLKPLEATVMLGKGMTFKADDLVLTKVGTKYTATVQTDTSNNFVAFSFLADGKYDNNYNNGFVRWCIFYIMF